MLPVVIQVLNKAVISGRFFTLLSRGILATKCRVHRCKYALAVVCATVCVFFFAALSLPEAILWRLNLCIISHSALCPRSAMTPATSSTLVALPHFQDNNSGRQTGSHNVAWLRQTTMDPAVLPITRLQNVFDFQLIVSFSFFQRGIGYEALLFIFSHLDCMFSAQI